MSSLQLDVSVRELMGSPARLASQIGLFRVGGEGTRVQRVSLTVINGALQHLQTPGKDLVVRCDRDVTVSVTLTDDTVLAIPVKSLLVLTSPFKSISVNYSDANAPADDVVDITIIQA